MRMPALRRYFDYVVAAGTPEFASSGLKVTSLVRLGYLAMLPESLFAGKIGSLPVVTLSLLLRRLSDFLAKP